MPFAKSFIPQDIALRLRLSLCRRGCCVTVWHKLKLRFCRHLYLPLPYLSQLTFLNGLTVDLNTDSDDPRRHTGFIKSPHMLL